MYVVGPGTAAKNTPERLHCFRLTVTTSTEVTGRSYGRAETFDERLQPQKKRLSIQTAAAEAPDPVGCCGSPSPFRCAGETACAYVRAWV